MTSSSTTQRSTVQLTQLRRAHWFKWMLLVAVFCTVGLYTAEFSHYHDTPAADLHCPICQVMAHSALDVFAPQFKPLPPAIRMHFLAFVPHQTPAPARVFTIKHQSRAPPLA